MLRLLCLLLALAALPAAAQDAVTFDVLDLDGDGQVTLAEAAGIDYVVERFDRADRNRDGQLSLAEFKRLERVKVRVAKARRERIRTVLARDARAAQHEADAEVAQAPSAAAGASR